MLENRENESMAQSKSEVWEPGQGTKQGECGTGLWHMSLRAGETGALISKYRRRLVSQFEKLGRNSIVCLHSAQTLRELAGVFDTVETV